MNNEIEDLKDRAKMMLNKPKQQKDIPQLTDSLVVFPREELQATIAALYFTLEHSTSEQFPLGVRQHMLDSLRRLDDNQV